MSTGTDSPVVDWDYDHEQDVLYLDIGDPMPSLVEEVPGVEGMHIRRAIADRRITGAAILWFSRQDVTALARHLPFSFDFGSVR